MVSYSVKLKCNTDRIQKNGSASLYLVVIINREVKPVPLNLSWPVHLVDNKTGTMTPRGKKDHDYNDYQLIITNELQKINEIFKIYRIQDRLLTMELFLDELKNMDRRRDFIAYMTYKIKHRFNLKEISVKTKQNHMSTLHRFVKVKKSLPFYTIDKKLLQRFALYLKTEYKNEDSTIWGRIKDIKTYLHFAKSEGISVNSDFENYKNTPPLPSVIYLDENEINSLMVLYNSKKLDDIRHQALRAFLFACFTSLRISDVQRVEWGWLQLNNELKFIPWKNRRFKREVNIPLSKIAKSLIERRIGKFFNLPTDQEINRSLKDIAKLCKPQIHKKLTFKLARHTFATHYYRQTKDLVSLQNIMGHSKVTMTMIYVHINDKDKKTGMDLMEESFLKNSTFMRLVG